MGLADDKGMAKEKAMIEIGSAAQAKPGQAAGAQKAQSADSREFFSRMLAAQLQNQNPMDAMDSQAMSGQLAQLSQANALSGISNALDALLESLRASREMQSAQMALGNRAWAAAQNGQKIESGDARGLWLRLPAGFDGQASLADESGKVLASWKGAGEEIVADLGPFAGAGAMRLSWQSGAGGHPQLGFMADSASVSGSKIYVENAQGTAKAEAGLIENISKGA